MDLLQFEPAPKGLSDMHKAIMPRHYSKLPSAFLVNLMVETGSNWWNDVSNS